MWFCIHFVDVSFKVCITFDARFGIIVAKRSLKSPGPKNKKNPPRKKFLIFQEMELSSANIEKILIFPELKACTFQTKLEK